MFDIFPINNVVTVGMRANAYPVARIHAQELGMSVTEFVTYAVYLAAMERERLDEALMKEDQWTVKSTLS